MGLSQEGDGEGKEDAGIRNNIQQAKDLESGHLRPRFVGTGSLPATLSEIINGVPMKTRKERVLAEFFAKKNGETPIPRRHEPNQSVHDKFACML